MKQKLIIQQNSINPYLSIITRCYLRPNGLSKNKESVNALVDKNWEQIQIVDEEGLGLHEANKSFSYVKNMVKGKWVYLLDDDDFLTNPDMIRHIRGIEQQYNPDVIVVRATILNGYNDNFYPAKECWNNKKPIKYQIGGGCVIVKAEVFKQHIDKFGEPICGDFAYIDSMYQSGCKFYWHDVKMAETGKVSRGEKE